MKLKAALALLAFTAVASIASPSDACINGVELEIMKFHATPAGQILLAEKDLEAGRNASAALRVRQQFSNIRSLDANAPPLGLRAQRIYALAIVRSDGKMDAEQWTTWANREWALETLSALSAKKQNPVATADLAEAQTSLARTRATGIATLEDLDRRDLLGSPHAYLALARARNAQGDAGGMLAAVRRCAMMSTDRKLCDLPEARAAV